MLAEVNGGLKSSSIVRRFSFDDWVSNINFQQLDLRSNLIGIIVIRILSSEGLGGRFQIAVLELDRVLDL